ncbi:MAG: ATP-binding protein [Phycisphaerae bacterium]|nr:ATP-binding protein [Phycisphaerae bacterium]
MFVNIQKRTPAAAPVLAGSRYLPIGQPEHSPYAVPAASDHRTREEQLCQSQKMEAIGQLAGGIAHDFSNIMTGIAGFAQLAREDLPPGHPAADSIREIEGFSEQACGLIRQLLAFSQQQPVEPVALNLNSIINRTCRLLGRLLGSEIRLELDLDTGLPPVRADEVQIEQVLMNLAVNARDAMSGRGRLTVRTCSVVLDQAELSKRKAPPAPGRYAALSVADTGCGMSRETQSRIFEPFFSTKPTGQHAGLGLATVCNIVRQHGGWIAIDSDVGRGCKFTVYLPLDRPK